MALFLIGGLGADEPHKRRGDEPRKDNFRRPMSLPVYAVKTQDGITVHKPEPTGEQRAQFNAARKRRFEIMVLIGAYKIMPEGQREALRSELLKRIQEDFNASIAAQKARIAKAEADLKKLRAEVAEREANSSKLIPFYHH